MLLIILTIKKSIDHVVQSVNAIIGHIKSNTDNAENIRVRTNEHLTYTYCITNTIIPIVIRSLSPSKTTAIQTKIEKTLNYHEATIPDHIESDDDDDNTEQ